MVLTMILTTVILFILYFKFIVFPLSKGGIYIPTKQVNIDRLFEMLDVKTTDTVADLGSGDGRILVTLAKKGINCTGYEINNYLCQVATKKLKQQKLEQFTTVINNDFFNEDLSQFSVVVFFQVFYVMDKLEKKLLAELKPGTKVASYCFSFPNLKPDKEHMGWFLYTIKNAQ